ncbi:MAG: Gmad2 immunoglobulin-like domain-containing protein [Patescibacteria group bacterium]
MSNQILYIIIAFAVILGVVATATHYLLPVAEAPTLIDVSTSTTKGVCQEDAMQCPDGLFVGRTGVNCEFVCPTPTVPADIQALIDAKADIIQVGNPAGMTVVTSPLSLAGKARGNWFFEASAPVSLVDWDGLIIAEGIITADGEWMTTDFVPFSGTLEFESPYNESDPDFMKRGALIFQKDNPSGLSENDDAVEIPILFAN